MYTRTYLHRWTVWSAVIVALMLTSCSGGGSNGGNGNNSITPIVQNVQATAVASQSITSSAGGTLTIPSSSSDWSGATLKIPAGALPTDVTVTVSEVSSFNYTGSLGVKKALKLEPSGTTFAVPLPFTVSYDPTLSDTEIEAQRFYIFDEKTNSMQELPVESIDKVAKTVKVNIPHFSILISTAELNDLDYVGAANKIKDTASNPTLRNYDTAKLALFLSNADIWMETNGQTVGPIKAKSQFISAKELYLLYRISLEQDAKNGMGNLTNTAYERMNQYFKLRSSHYGDPNITIEQDWIDLVMSVSSCYGTVAEIKSNIESPILYLASINYSLEDVYKAYFDLGLTLLDAGITITEKAQINQTMFLLDGAGISPDAPLSSIDKNVYGGNARAAVKANFIRSLGGWGKDRLRGIKFRTAIEEILKRNLADYETLSLDFGSDIVTTSNNNTILYMSKGTHTFSLKSLNKTNWYGLPINASVVANKVDVYSITQTGSNVISKNFFSLSDNWDINVDQPIHLTVTVHYDITFPDGKKDQSVITKEFTIKKFQQKTAKSLAHNGSIKVINKKLSIARKNINVSNTGTSSSYRLKSPFKMVASTVAGNDYPYNKILGQLFDSQGVAVGDQLEMGHDLLDFNFPSDGYYTIKLTAMPYMTPQDYNDGVVPTVERILNVTVGSSFVTQLTRTGQTTSYAAGDDGSLQKGVAWPTPRFTDNANGTVTDNLTSLIWLKYANCFGSLIWSDARASTLRLASGACGLSDNSTVGQWRLPSISELENLVDIEHVNPAIPTDHPFSAVQAGAYWSSTDSYVLVYGTYWYVDFQSGMVSSNSLDVSHYVWPVRNAL